MSRHLGVEAVALSVIEAFCAPHRKVRRDRHLPIRFTGMRHWPLIASTPHGKHRFLLLLGHLRRRLYAHFHDCGRNLRQLISTDDRKAAHSPRRPR